MAKNMQPIAKRCRALDIFPATMGYAKKGSNRNPGSQMRKKESKHALQLTEKQKVKFVYGIVEKQFRIYCEKATHMPDKTSENSLTSMERHLGNVVYRLGFAMTRRETRQLMGRGHFTVNDQRVDIPPYLVKAGDAIEVKESSHSSAKFRRLTGENTLTVLVSKWLGRGKGTLKDTVVQMSVCKDIDLPIEEHLIVELYSE